MTKNQWLHQVQGRRWVRIGGGIAAATALVWGGLWLALPGVVAQQIEHHASQVLGRTVTVRSVEVAPWSLAVTVRGLAVAAAPDQATSADDHPRHVAGGEPLLAVERIYINASVTSVLRWAPVLDAIELDAPVVRVQQMASGVWSFTDIMDRLQAGPPDDAASAEPAPVALYNIQIKDGQVHLDDQVAGVQHTIEDLQLQLPFISTLPSQREVHVQPQLSLRLNGSLIASQAVGTPFDTAHATQATLNIEKFDLAPYAPYLPASVPVRLQQGVLNAQLQVAFEQTQAPTVQLQGSRFQVSGLQVADRMLQPLVGWQALEVLLGDTRPLQQEVQLSHVRLEQPYAHVHRYADGGFLPPLASAVTAQDIKAVEPPSESVAASADWAIRIGQLDVQSGAVDWRDDVNQVGAHIQVRDWQLQAHDLTWPMQQDARWSTRAQLQSAEQAALGSLYMQGQGVLDQGHAALVVQNVDAQGLAAYAQQWLKVPVAARASLNAGVAWKNGQFHVRVPSLSLDALAVGRSNLPEAGWEQLQVRNVAIDSAQQQVQIGQVDLQAPFAAVQRDAQGRWMYEHWLQPVIAAPAKESTTVHAPDGKPWQVLVQDVHLAAGRVELVDESLGDDAMAVQLSDVQWYLHNIDSLQGLAQTRLSARLSERLRPGRWGKPGTLFYEGKLGLEPLLAQGRVRLQALPLQAFEPFIAPLLNVHVVRALGSFEGDVRYAQQAQGPQLQLKGQARIADVHVQTVVGDAAATQAVQGPQTQGGVLAEDLLRWKQLRLDGIDVRLQPAQAPRVHVRNTALQDFYARVVVLPQGRLNLQNLLKSAEEGPSVSDELAPSADPVVADAVAAPAPQTDPLAPRIEMGPVALQRGVINFSDYFIQPNYSAELTALNGSLDAFSSHPSAQGEGAALAALHLAGVAQGTGQLLVQGKINPLVQPLAMDVQAKVNGLDLSPLTPYAIKYAGHGIEKGKLSMDVRYQVQPDGQLTATNQLVLNQLTFTDPIEGAPTSLPVRLAVALLADGQGVIDLNLPISGSLNDPQFRVAPVVFKIIGNIVRKAVTAPFSLLTGAFASADERSDIAFAAGRSILDANAHSQLDQLAKAMQSKVQLKLTLSGSVDASAEAPAWKQAQLERLVAAHMPSNADTLTPTQREKRQQAALEQVYRKTVKDKPRNMVGLAKDLPAAEMRTLIFKEMVIPSSAWPELATARTTAVRDYLLAQGVDAQRIFLGAVAEKTTNATAPAVLLNISVQ
jgi:uncharacterized protein involved in outer membrane biogenesis